MAARRETVGDTCALWHSGNVLYGVPKVDGARVPDGMASTTLKVPENLGLVAFLINDTLPGAVPSYRAFRKWPFQFLGRRREFVAEIMRRLGDAPAILDGFTIRPRYTLEARIVAPSADPLIGLFVTLTTRYDIGPELQELAAAGVVLAGMDVVRRSPARGQRRLVGRIDRLAGDQVVLSEATEQITHIPAADVAVEGSKDAFVSCPCGSCSVIGTPLSRSTAPNWRASCSADQASMRCSRKWADSSAAWNRSVSVATSAVGSDSSCGSATARSTAACITLRPCRTASIRPVASRTPSHGED